MQSNYFSEVELPARSNAENTTDCIPHCTTEKILWVRSNPRPSKCNLDERLVLFVIASPRLLDE